MLLSLVGFRLDDFEMSTCGLEASTVAYLPALRFYNDFTNLKPNCKLQRSFVSLDAIMKFSAPQSDQEANAFAGMKVAWTLD